MDTVVLILKSFVLVLLDVLQFAMLLRAIMSFFDRGNPGTFSTFLAFVTEPFIMPIRLFCERRRLFEGSVVDVPFFITVLLLMFLQMLLAMI